MDEKTELAILRARVIQRSKYTRVRVWARRLMAAALRGISTPDDRKSYINIPEVRPWFWMGPVDGGRAMAPGTFFRLWGGWVTAAHVVEEMNYNLPPFADGSLNLSPRYQLAGNDVALDVALIGCNVPSVRPITAQPGDRVVVVAWPGGGTREPEIRWGRYYMERDVGTSIALLDEGELPVYRGMSGGCVLAEVDGVWRVEGILNYRDSPIDSDNDGEYEQAFDYVPLFRVWDALVPDTILA